MSKFLTEAAWKSVLQKQKGGVKDPGLQKALAAYEKLKEDAYDERLKALKLIAKLASDLKSAKDTAALKEVRDYLGELIGAAAKEQGTLEKQQKAAPVAAGPSKVATVNTPFGAFAYFADDKANARLVQMVENIVINLEDAGNDANSMKSASEEAEKLQKKLPTRQDIEEEVKKADLATSEAARAAKRAMGRVEDYKTNVVHLQEDVAHAAEAAKAALSAFKGVTLEDKAEKLKAQAEELKSGIEKLLSSISTVVDLVTKGMGPNPLGKLELLATAADTLGTLFSVVGGPGDSLLAQADEAAAMAKELKLDAAHASMVLTKKRLDTLMQRQPALKEQVKRIKEEAELQAKVPMKAFDKKSGKFDFAELEAYADTLAEVCDLAQDVMKRAQDAYATSAVLLGVVKPQKWKLPDPGKSKDTLEKAQEQATKLKTGAENYFKKADLARADARTMYAVAQDGLTRANT